MNEWLYHAHIFLERTLFNITLNMDGSKEYRGVLYKEGQLAHETYY